MPDVPGADLAPLETLRLYPPHDYTLHSALLSRASIAPERTFLAANGSELSWSESVRVVERLARALASRGIARGERVAIMARNSEKHVLLLAALARLRAIMVPVNPDFGPDEAGYVFEHAQVTAIACDAAALPAAEEARRRRGLSPWFMMLDENRPGMPDFDQLCGEAGGSILPPDVAPLDTCLIVYTSGTTGFPKGVMHSQQSFLLTGEVFLQRMRLQPQDRLLVLLPLFHVNALFYSIAGAIAAGCTAIVAQRFSASNFWKLAAETGATQTNVIEAIGSILVNRPRSEYDPRHRIRKMYGVRAAAAATFVNEFNVPHIVSGYGMTEIPGALSPEFGAPARPGSMGNAGRHPDPSRRWTECRVLDDEHRDVAPNEVGELAVRTPNIMQGYFRDEKQTAEAFHDGWFLTGDLVRRDADGYFSFVSRKKDLIRRRGENIAGTELDRVIGEHPGVKEVAAVATPSELGEDEILVAVVPKADASLTAKDIAEWCSARLTENKVPRYVVFLDELPHTPTHKVAKNVLRADPTLRLRAIDRLAAASPRRT